MISKQSAIDEYEALRRNQDVRDLFALAEDHLGLTRCIGGRLRVAGYACTHCQSYMPNELCKAPIHTQTGELTCEKPCSSQDCTC